MVDDKKNIPDARKADEPPKPGKVEPAKAAPPGAGLARPSQGRGLRGKGCVQGGNAPYGGAASSGG